MLIFILLILRLNAQDYKKDILSVSEYFGGLKSYSLTMNYQLFIDGNNHKPYQERKLEIKKNGLNMLVIENNGLEVLENMKYQVFINKPLKTIIPIKKNKDINESGGNIIKDIMKVNLDSINLIYEKIRFIESKNGLVVYEMIYKENNEVDKLILTINKKTSMYESVVIHYKKKIRIKEMNNTLHSHILKVTYKSFTPGYTSKPYEFDHKNYFNENNGKIVLNNNYRDYKVSIPN